MDRAYYFVIWEIVSLNILLIIQMNVALVTLVACMMIWGAQSVLKVTCGTTGCPAACSSFGCIRF